MPPLRLIPIYLRCKWLSSFSKFLGFINRSSFRHCSVLFIRAQIPVKSKTVPSALGVLRAMPVLMNISVRKLVQNAMQKPTRNGRSLIIFMRWRSHQQKQSGPTSMALLLRISESSPSFTEKMINTWWKPRMSRAKCKPLKSPIPLDGSPFSNIW